MPGKKNSIEKNLDTTSNEINEIWKKLEVLRKKLEEDRNKCAWSRFRSEPVDNGKNILNTIRKAIKETASGEKKIS